MIGLTLDNDQTIASHPQSNDDDVTLDAVQYRDAWQLAPARKSEPLEQRETRLVVSKDESDQRVDLQLGACASVCDIR